MAEEVIEIHHRKRISERRKNCGGNTSTEITNNINLINENECERSVDGANNNNDDERVLTKTSNSKVFLTKYFPKRPLSLPASRVSDVNHNLTNYLNETTTEDNGNNEDRREKRKTFHQDVEEALNSLLWQPYEYQNKRTFSDSSSFSLSYTSCSSSSSLSSLDLEEYNNGSSAERVGNIAMDLHLAQEEMVNNLSLNRCNQSEDRACSRDRPKASRLSGCNRTTVSECCAAVVCSGEGACDDFGSKCDMRLEIPPSTTNSNNPNQDGNNCYQRSISTGNLSSANVVGLPPRQTSMPLPGNGIIFPNPPRNTSEPLQFRYNPPSASTFNHQRHSSHVDTTAASSVQPNLVQHMRSASVPKNMQPQKVGESNAKMINEELQRALNVSNVNVNFYRAVPVNVVSSVPTIQCVNSSSDTGNNVSNVHIMPLSGSSLPTPHNNSTTITTVPSMSFSTTVTGTTQVSVHNTQLPSYNVQIPTHTVQVQQTCSSTQVQTSNQPNITSPPKRPQTTTATPSEPRTRTFTSTEAQTDEISVCSPPTTSDSTARERRRERRRQQRRLTNNNTTTTNERLPDILNSHLPPPYSPLVQQPPPPPQVLPPPPPGALVQPPLVPNIVPSAIVGNAILPYPAVPGQVPLVQTTATPMPVTATATGFRFPFPASGFRR